MNTKEAWLHMISKRGIEDSLGITARSRDWFRSRARNQNKYPTLNKMEEQLIKAGFKVLQEKVWG